MRLSSCCWSFKRMCSVMRSIATMLLPLRSSSTPLSTQQRTSSTANTPPAASHGPTRSILSPTVIRGALRPVFERSLEIAHSLEMKQPSSVLWTAVQGDGTAPYVHAHVCLFKYAQPARRASDWVWPSCRWCASSRQTLDMGGRDQGVTK